jgi:hypothetical protein
MKTLIAMLAAAFALTTAAEANGPARVPTGIDVKGSTYYRMVPVAGGGHKVVHQNVICDTRNIQGRDTRCVFDGQGANEAGAGPGSDGGFGPGEVK